MMKTLPTRFWVSKKIILAAFLAAGVAGVQSAYGEHDVRGKVIDNSTGKALAGARVSVIDGTATTMTGEEGLFTLSTPDGRVLLRVEAPGFDVAVVPVQGADSLNIRLLATTTGSFYSPQLFQASGVTEKNNFSMSETTGDQSVEQQQGALFSIHRSGMSGSGSAIFVEGLHSINTSWQPLYVVDGVEWSVTESEFSLFNGHYNNPLALIDPKDIASISVLRNGTALYGTKGANGVVIIETRRARNEATEIEAWAMLGVKQKAKSIPVMDASAYRLYVSDVIEGRLENGENVNSYNFLNDDPTSRTYLANHNNTDWLDLTTRTGILMNYGVSVRGGDDQALYSFSLGYTKNDANIKKTSFDRLNVRFNSDINLWKGFKLRFDVAFAQATWDIFNDGIDELSSPYYLSLIKSPLYHPNVISNRGEITVKYSDVDELGVGNPLSIIDLGIGNSRNYRFNLNVAPQYRFNDAFAIDALLGYTFDKIKDNSFLPDYGVADVPLTNANGEIYATMKNRVENLMNRHSAFVAKIAGRYTPLHDYAHGLDLQLGWRFRNDVGTVSYGQGLNTSSDFMNSMGNTTASLRTSDGANSKWREMAWYLTAQYAFMKRYIFHADVVAETSNRFGSKAPDALHLCGLSWGIFPSINAAWILSSENFMKKLPFINFAKIRLGWEMAGNGNLPDYATSTYFMSVGLLGHAFGPVLANLGNDRLKWETTATFRVGLDMSLFRNRWNFNFDFYKSHTTDLLVRTPLHEEAGLEYFWSNGGELNNTGVNFATNVRALNLSDWKIDIGAAIGHYRNRVTKLDDGSFLTDIDGAQILTAEGQPLGTFYGYRFEGVFSTADEADAAGLSIRNINGSYTAFEAGDARFADNGDKVIDQQDCMVIGDPNPDFFGNFNLRLQWKNLSLSTMFSFVSGNDVYNGLRARLENGADIYNQSVSLSNRWMAAGQITDIPRATYGDPMGNARFSNRWIEDGSYLKWKNIQLSYDVPLHTQFLQGISIWVAVNNLCTWSRYLGADPEFFSGISPLCLGVDNGLMAPSREFNFGIKINL